MLFLSSNISTTFHPRWSCSSCICFLLGMTGPRLLEVLEITPGTFSASRHGTRSFLTVRVVKKTQLPMFVFFCFFSKNCVYCTFGVWLLGFGCWHHFFLACVVCVGTDHCKCPTWTHFICQYAADGVRDDHCDLPSAYRLGHSNFTYCIPLPLQIFDILI